LKINYKIYSVFHEISLLKTQKFKLVDKFLKIT
jgi:hypothetical protein